MLDDKTEGAWSSLRFEEAVLSAFSFLVRHYGFKCTATEVNCVRYESSDVFVRVSHNQSSFELNAEVGLLDRNTPVEEDFTVWEVARLSGAPELNTKMFLQASTPDRVTRLVPELADVLARYGERALKGEQAFYLALREQQLAESEQFIAEGLARRVRQEASLAWHERDYARFLRLMEGVSEHELRPSERQKLIYARQQLTSEL